MSDSFEKNYVTSYPMRTICGVLREIYWHTDDEIVKEKTMEATGMAKRMDAKLRKYKSDWDSDMWETLDNYEEVLEQRRKMYREKKDAVKGQ